MIEKRINIHDQFQLEIKLGYQFKSQQKITRYRIDTFLFFPNTLGVNSLTYPKEEFYSDIQSYIRFMTPAFSLKDISNDENRIFFPLLKQIKLLSDRANSKNEMSTYEYEIKIFCCIVKNSLDRWINDFLDSATPNSILNADIETIQTILQNYRNLSHLLPNQEHIKKFRFGDEYLSLLVERAAFKLLELISQKSFKKEKKYREDILSLISKENEYRKQMNYPSLIKPGSNNEEFVFRMSVLKKYIESALFLNTHTEKEGKIMQQVFFGLSAGIAMIFATVIAFLTQTHFGTLTFPFFAALVTYIFRDRIKEVLRIYFSERMQQKLFDYHKEILASPKKTIGISKESFNFIHEKSIPEKILQIRRNSHITEIEKEVLNEKIIIYRKQIDIFSFKFREFYSNSNIDGINDILRINVSHFLKKMDNPEKVLFALEGNDYKKIHGERVYHINMILRFITCDDIFYERFRIVLNRNGIKRIEEIHSEKEAKT